MALRCVPGRAALLVLLLAAAVPATAQEAEVTVAGSGSLLVYLDCERCFFDYVRQEIDYINWVRDPRDAQVHVLVTFRSSGGMLEYRLEYIGRDTFAGQDQVLLFSSSNTDTDVERRDGFVRTLMLGLARYIAQTPLAARAALTVAEAGQGQTGQVATPEGDPWNFWVISLGLLGGMSGEERRDTVWVEGEVSANRTTEAWKLRFGAEDEYEESDFVFDDGSTFKNVARELNVGAQAIKSLGEHWGAGIGGSLGRSTFFNLDPSYRVAGALEYDVYPYSQSSTHALTIAYFLGGSRFNYEEETIFETFEETLVDQGIVAELDLERPWGSASFNLEARHFLKYPSEIDVELFGALEYRIIRGLSLGFQGSFERVRSQRYLPRRGATEEEVLLKRRALATDYRLELGIGIRYTFGSIYNNVVNSRLAGQSRGFHRIF